ncbi:MAG: FeoA family protein [Sporolactobacillus sp.]
MDNDNRCASGFVGGAISHSVPVRAQRPALPLNFVHTGESVRIRSVSGKDETKRFLHTLGLIDDAEVTVLSESGGNVIVCLKGARLAINQAMARRVMTY